jgi:hypothetical protein
VTTMSGSSGRAAVRCQEPAVNHLAFAGGSRGRSYGRLPQGLRDTDSSRTPGLACWADDLIDMLRFEVQEAARRAVITTGESEQLLARLVLVIDQALSSTETPPHSAIV